MFQNPIYTHPLGNRLNEILFLDTILGDHKPLYNTHFMGKYTFLNTSYVTDTLLGSRNQ